jgi:hypothetical protein
VSADGGTAAGYLERLDRVQDRLAAHAAGSPAPGLTDPDEPSGERWEWGQVWAHLAEFVPYWTQQIRHVLDRPASEDLPAFGRTKSDPGRIAAIEADRDRPPAELMARLAHQLEELRAFTRGLSERDWGRKVRHSTLGVLDMPNVFEMFLMGHLEAHADQLDGLAAAGGSP